MLCWSPYTFCVSGLHTETISAAYAENSSRSITGNPTGRSTASGLFSSQQTASGDATPRTITCGVKVTNHAMRVRLPLLDPITRSCMSLDCVPKSRPSSPTSKRKVNARSRDPGGDSQIARAGFSPFGCKPPPLDRNRVRGGIKGGVQINCLFTLLVIWFVTLMAMAQTNVIPRVGETWFFDDRNPWHRTYYEGTVLAVSNGWVLVKDSLGKTNSWSVGAMGTFHKKTPPVPNQLSLRSVTTNYVITNAVLVQANTSTNIVITITIQK